MDGIGRKNQSNYSYPVGFGYITIPSGVDRDLYIKTCYNKERVAIQLDDGGGVIQNCYISRKAIQDILFPLKSTEMGSCVCFIIPKHYNLPIITDVISKADETQLLEEYSFKKTIRSKNASVSIEGKGKAGELFINVDSKLENGGNIFITLKNKSNGSKFNVKCFGDIELHSEGETSVKSFKNINLKKVKIDNGEEVFCSEITLHEEGFEIKDSTGNTLTSNLEGEINILPKSICNIFEEGQPIPLGRNLQTELNKLKDRFDTFLNTYSNTPVVPSDGGLAVQKAVKAATVNLEEENFDEINSQKSFAG